MRVATITELVLACTLCASAVCSARQVAPTPNTTCPDISGVYANTPEAPAAAEAGADTKLKRKGRYDYRPPEDEYKVKGPLPLSNLLLDYEHPSPASVALTVEPGNTLAFQFLFDNPEQNTEVYRRRIRCLDGVVAYTRRMEVRKPNGKLADITMTTRLALQANGYLAAAYDRGNMLLALPFLPKSSIDKNQWLYLAQSSLPSTFVALTASNNSADSTARASAESASGAPADSTTSTSAESASGPPADYSATERPADWIPAVASPAPTDCPQLAGAFINKGMGAANNPPGHADVMLASALGFPRETQPDFIELKITDAWLDGALRWVTEPSRDEQIRLKLRCFEGAVLVESVDTDTSVATGSTVSRRYQAHLSMLADGTLLLKELRTWRNFGSVFRRKADPNNPDRLSWYRFERHSGTPATAEPADPML